LHQKLEWNAIGFQSKTQILRGKIQEEKDNEPSSNLKKLRTIQLFLDELDHLLNTMERIKSDLIPKLEKIFRLTFKTPELLMLAMARKSIRNIYEDLETHFKTTSLKPDEYKELASSCEAGDVLALIGDAVLDLAIVQVHWDTSLATAGKLTEKRKETASNEHLAIISDKWGLCDYRLYRLNAPKSANIKPETIIHEKATLVEAIYGVIYLEFGFDELIRTLPFIQ
jgi:dsRNA-specific ribonuclease